MPEQITLPTFEELIASSEQASESADKWEFMPQDDDEADEDNEKERVAA